MTLDCAHHSIIGPGRGMFVTGVSIGARSNVTVRNCYIRDVDDGFTLHDTTDSTFADNKVSHAERGVQLNGAHRNTFTNNHVEDVNDWFGFGLFDGSTDNELRSNSTDAVGGLGFIIWQSHDNVIADNTALNGFGIGLGANAGASGNVFSNNTSAGNTGWQIEDQTVGGGTSGTANIWTANSCSGGGSSPGGLC